MDNRFSKGKLNRVLRTGSRNEVYNLLFECLIFFLSFFFKMAKRDRHIIKTVHRGKWLGLTVFHLYHWLLWTLESPDISPGTLDIALFSNQWYVLQARQSYYSSPFTETM